MIRRNGCEREVELLGLRSDVGELSRAFDLHLSSSSAEAFPNVVGKRCFRGTPNVVTDVGDSAFIVGKTGWVVPAQDPERMAEAISGAYREWAQRNDRWQQRRVEARRRIVERFTFDRMIHAYEEVWKLVIATRLNFSLDHALQM